MPSLLGCLAWPAADGTYNIKPRVSSGQDFIAFIYSTLTPMTPSEQTPLLNGNGRQPSSPSFYPKVVALLKAEGEPSWLDSYRWFIFGSWLNLLLLLVPVAAAAHYLNWDAPLRFGFSFVAIIPLAKVCSTRARRPGLYTA